MNDQGHPTQQPAKSEISSKPSTFRSQATERKSSIEQDKCHSYCGGCPVSCELTEALCLYSIHPKSLFVANLPQKGKEEEEKTTSPTDYTGNGNVPVFTAANTIFDQT